MEGTSFRGDVNNISDAQLRGVFYGRNTSLQLARLVSCMCCLVIWAVQQLQLSLPLWVRRSCSDAEPKHRLGYPENYLFYDQKMYLWDNT